MDEVNVVEKLEVWVNMLQLDKQDIERYRERSKIIRETIRQDKQLEKKKKKRLLLKLEKGVRPQKTRKTGETV